MSPDWRKQPERGSSLALHTIRWIAMHVGRPAARLLLYPITLYFFVSAGHARRMSHSFLRRAGVPNAHMGHVFRHFHTFAAVVLDRIYFMLGDLDRFDIRLHLDEGVSEYLTDPGGAILLGAHVGSFDALRALGMTRGRVRLRVLMAHDHNRLITRLLEGLNPQLADTVIPLGRPDTLLYTRDWVEDGGCVAVLADRMPAEDAGRSGRSVCCDFLGHPARLPTGPIQLAATLRTPVLLFFGIYRGGRSYDVHVEWFADADTMAASRDADAIAAHVSRYADRLAAHVRDAPYNWFNFYDFWETDEWAATDSST